MTQAIVLREPGGPGNLLWESVVVGQPGPGQLRVRHTAIGVNFHDTYVRSGLYQTLALPGIPGLEAAGVVEETGPGVSGFAPGDRIAYIDRGYGAYSQQRLLSASLALKLPASISDDTAASVMVKGITACMLLRRVYAVGPGDTILVHAGAGGVGQPLVRWGKRLGARVITTVGSQAKAQVARDCGADEVILYREENFVERVKALTGGNGVNVVYDSVGADTFLGSLECLAFFGKLVNFGQSSGPVAPFAVSLLSARSASVTRPMLFHWLRDRTQLEALAAETFAAIDSGVIRPEVGLRLPLAQAGAAHAAIESRATTGSVVLIP